MKLLWFTAVWCGPCRMMKTKFPAESLPVPVEFIDVEVKKELLELYEVKTIPTFILVNQVDSTQHVIAQRSGTFDLNDWIKRNV